MGRICGVILAVVVCFTVVEPAISTEGGKTLQGGKNSEKSGGRRKGQSKSADVNEVRIEKDVSYLGPGRDEKADLYMPATTDEKQQYPAIVIIHGGGWSSGDKAKPRQQKIAKTLVQHGYVCMSINYLLFGEVRPSWPQNIYDCKSAVQFLRKNAAAYKIDAEHIGVIGGSAGGHLTAMVALVGPEANLEPPSLYKGISSKVQAAVPLYGIYNLLNFEHKKDRAERYLGVHRELDTELWKLASPVSHISKDDPPFLVIHGTADEVVDPNHSIELHEKLKKKGVESELILIEGAGHSFDLQPEQQDLRPKVLTFFDKHLKDKNK